MLAYTGDSVCMSGVAFRIKEMISLMDYYFQSFVRSVSMDTWQEDQIRRMKVIKTSFFTITIY